MKILIAEDDPISRRVLEATLVEWGYDILVASDGSEAWELLQKPDAPNLVISDWMMPHMDGLELCRRIRQMERSGYVYFIILTGKGGKEDVIEGLEAGADDFLIKPFDREELKCRAKIGERIINLELRILELANTDALTGVLNRRAFMERMDQEIRRSLREDVPLSLILTDIDYFKRVNDRYGHQVGDLVLQRFTEQLSESSRPYDFVGRYGGEEFVVCLPGVDVSQARSVAERMRRRVEETGIMLPDSSQSIRITGSFGVAYLRTGSEETVDLITGRADDTMYRAKREGRNRVCVASEEGH
ncbi:MAG: diguanylate cyclase [Deltaproteobacteria bacterium]|nr:diguanylate cyclase [Deltaproteobacteria bacterium]